MKLKKSLTSLFRAALQIGGAVALVKPSLVPIVDALGQAGPAVGAAVAAIGVIWGQVRAVKTARLTDAVNASPALPSAVVVENGLAK